MTKRQMVEAIAEKSGITNNQVEVAKQRFESKSREFVELAYDMFVNGKISAVYAMSVGSGILFKE